jgi:hypothetical protein
MVVISGHSSLLVKLENNSKYCFIYWIRPQSHKRFLGVNMVEIHSFTKKAVNYAPKRFYCTRLSFCTLVAAAIDFSAKSDFDKNLFFSFFVPKLKIEHCIG